MKKIFLSLIVFIALHSFSFGQVSLTSWATGLSSPIDLKHAGDERVFIVQKNGTIKIANQNGVVSPNNFLDIISRVRSSGSEQGLLGLAFHPDYKNNGYFFVNYTSQPSGHTRISRFSVTPGNPDLADANSEVVVLEINQPYSNHNGGHLAFSPVDGYLYIGTGDGGSGGDPGNRAQSLDSLLGKTLRIDVNSLPYSIPCTNPYVGVPGRDEIWHSGLRNPWRWSFDQWNGDLWIGDVGQNAYEEVDYQPASSKGGENYGWRCYEGKHTYNTAGCGPMTDYDSCLYEFSQSSNSMCSVIGGYVYRGAKYSSMFGKYYFADYCNPAIRVIERSGNNWALSNLGNLGGSSISAMGEDVYGEIYAVDLGGTIYKFNSSSCQPVAFISASDTLYACGSSKILRTPNGKNYNYEWFFNGNAIPNSNNDSLTASQSGNYYVTATDSANCTATSGTVYVNFVSPPVINVTGLDTFYCVNHSPALLTGTPIGGKFCGPGITNIRYFDPAIAGPGDHTISYIYTDPLTGCTNTLVLSTHVDICASSGDEGFLRQFEVFPNPAADFLSVIISPFQAQDLKLEIFNSIGELLHADWIASNTGTSIRKDISLISFAKGLYTLKITGLNQSATKAFVKN